MASGFPGSIDNFTDPLSNSSLSSPSHSGLHSDVNDAIEKIETYMGLVKVIPTGATNGTVAANGTVTIGTSITSLTISGAFSSLYNDYLVRITDVSASADNIDVSLQMRSGSTTAATNYNAVYHYVTYSGSINVVGTSNGVTFPYVAGSVNNTLTAAIDIAQPFLARNTVIRCINPRGNLTGTSSGYHNTAASYDSFVLSFSAAVTGGKLTIYGYRN